MVAVTNETIVAWSPTLIIAWSPPARAQTQAETTPKRGRLWRPEWRQHGACPSAVAQACVCARACCHWLRRAQPAAGLLAAALCRGVVAGACDRGGAARRRLRAVCGAARALPSLPARGCVRVRRRDCAKAAVGAGEAARAVVGLSRLRQQGKCTCFNASAAWHIVQGFPLGPMTWLNGADAKLAPLGGAVALHAIPGACQAAETRPGRDAQGQAACGSPLRA